MTKGLVAEVQKENNWAWSSSLKLSVKGIQQQSHSLKSCWTDTGWDAVIWHPSSQHSIIRGKAHSSSSPVPSHQGLTQGRWAMQEAGGSASHTASPGPPLTLPWWWECLKMGTLGPDTCKDITPPHRVKGRCKKKDTHKKRPNSESQAPKEKHDGLQPLEEQGWRQALH